MGAAASDGLVDANPVQISGAGSTKRAKRIRPATLAELRTITEAMPPRYRAMVLLSSWGALRFGNSPSYAAAMSACRTTTTHPDLSA